MAERFQYDQPGTLSRPGPIGRVARLALGLLSAYAVVLILAGAPAFHSGRALRVSSVWFMILLAFYFFPDIVNIGFGKAWKRGHLYLGLVVLAGLSALVSWAEYGSPLGPPLGILVGGWLVYAFGHMGIAFFLATLLGTPGCEMRSIPQLWSLVTGRGSKEYYCPGMLTPIDRWEGALRAKRRGKVKLE